MNLNEAEKVLDTVLESNKILISEGKRPITVELVGEAGIGKTGLIRDYASKIEYDFVQIDLSSLEDVGDLTGMPIRMYLLENTDTNESSWVPEKAADILLKQSNYKYLDVRTSYSIPEWIPDENKPTIVLLDDAARAHPKFGNAVMRLIDEGKYGSAWELPKNCLLVLTNNPDDGNYNVNPADDAQKTRCITVNIEFDIDTWAKWAEDYGLDNRIINFVLMNPEIFNSRYNPRTITKLANSICSFKDYVENLDVIANISNNTVGEQISSKFIAFINNGLDKVITPQEVLLGDFDTVKSKLLEFIYKGSSYSSVNGALMSTRIANYANYKGSKIMPNKKLVERLSELLTDKQLFTEDLCYRMLKTLTSYSSVRYKKFYQNPMLRNKILA